MGPRHFSRGKAFADEMEGRHFAASMGPRHFSRGKTAEAVAETAEYCRFNGATAFQPWKDVPSDTTAPTNNSGFNGATAFQPWKALVVKQGAIFDHCASMGPRHFSRGKEGDGAHLHDSTNVLQWGHGISAVERGFGWLSLAIIIGASMGPRHFSRGKADCSAW